VVREAITIEIERSRKASEFISPWRAPAYQVFARHSNAALSMHAAKRTSRSDPALSYRDRWWSVMPGS
jgi:hypothetical protein